MQAIDRSTNHLSRPIQALANELVATGGTVVDCCFCCCFGPSLGTTMSSGIILPPLPCLSIISPFCATIVVFAWMVVGRFLVKVHGRGDASAVQSKKMTQATTVTATIRKMRDHWARGKSIRFEYFRILKLFLNFHF